jgi:hypothetical protein
MPSKPEAGKRVSRPQPIEMDEIEHVRQMLEERNRDLSTFSDLPHDELMEIVGLGPGATLSKVVSRRLETAHNQDEKLGDDVEDALNDLRNLAIQSMYEPLSEADIWRLCYRMAYLVGRNISVTRESVRLMKQESLRVRQAGGKSRWKAYSPIRDRFASLVPDSCYGDDGKRLTKAKVVDVTWRSLANVFPETSMPTEETVKEWLTQWHKAEGFPAWPKLPKHRNQWPQS